MSMAWFKYTCFLLFTLWLTDGCSHPALTPEQAKSLLLEQMLREDGQIIAICQSLDDYQWKKIQYLPPQSRRQVLYEAIGDLQTLFYAMDIPNQDAMGCSAITLIDNALAQKMHWPLDELRKWIPPHPISVQNCSQYFQKHWRLDSKASHQIIAKILIQSGVTPRMLIENPLEVIEKIDLSPAVIQAVLGLAQAMEGQIQDLSSSLGVASGITKVLLDRVAAEILAKTLDELIDLLESKGWIRATHLARRACNLYVNGSPRSLVSQRLLKRMILKFDDPKTYAFSKVCAQLKEIYTQDLCQKFYEQTQSHPNFFKKIIHPPHLLKLHPSLKSINLSQFDEAAKAHAQMWKRTAQSCGPSCTLQTWTTWIGQSAVQGAEKTQDSIFIPQSSTRQDERETQEILIQQVKNLTQSIDLQAQEIESMHRDLMLSLQGFKKCQSEIRTTQTKRIEFAQRELGIFLPQNFGCRARELEQKYRSNILKGLEMSGHQICDVFRGMSFELSLGSLFEPCQGEIDPKEALSLHPLIKALEVMEVKKMIVVGHSDQRKAHRCPGPYRNNEVLSAVRASSVAQYLQKHLKDLEIRSYGMGDRALLKDCRLIRDQTQRQACHQANRRVHFEILESKALDIDLSCLQ